MKWRLIDGEEMLRKKYFPVGTEKNYDVPW